MARQRERHPVDIRFGTRVRARREARGWTIGRLAREAVLTTSFVGQVERGQESPGINSMAKLAKALEVGTDQLLADLDQLADTPLRLRQSE